MLLLRLHVHDLLRRKDYGHLLDVVIEQVLQIEVVGGGRILYQEQLTRVHLKSNRNERNYDSASVTNLRILIKMERQ
jgi:hypothetical protein